MTDYVVDETETADDGDSSDLAYFLSDTRDKNKGKRGKKQQQTPLPGKTDKPNNLQEEKQAIDLLLSAYRQMIDVSAKKSRKSCIGHWDSEGPLVKILEKPVETITRTSGTARSGVVYLQPEEWVLFVERGTLVIQKQNAGLEQTTEDLADVWVRALDRSGFSLDEYRAYSYLRRLGYVVVCPKHEVAAENSSRMDCSLEETKASSLHRSETRSGWLADCFNWLNRFSWLSWPAMSRLKYTYDDVYNDLLNHAPRNAILGATGNSLFSGGYGVYKPEHPFKKRDPGQPQYRLVIVSAQSRAPATDELLEMAHSDSAISTVFGVSEPGVAGFLKALPSVVPKAPHRQRQRQDETPK